ncbi:hypothetical protein PHLGIDRAFT_305697 [Phlebiopsis gigantea 11061_1 CR5-6]|uniref:Peptidase S33 tripeptidyl aminopeptidase-like C-terminal domain-containing protein n=1 Tax=Phlebiopsis gigantea (strain 11061_1 CR5-6) TaxID=745531 RepID=A0A0C3RQR0_PHLG1|nr:hypothetical protein PHLGIDRAFT_305697 [Phlebiopsis gigantea 11061_1 CR5-6]
MSFHGFLQGFPGPTLAFSLCESVTRVLSADSPHDEELGRAAKTQDKRASYQAFLPRTPAAVMTKSDPWTASKPRSTKIMWYTAAVCAAVFLACQLYVPSLLRANSRPAEVTQHRTHGLDDPELVWNTVPHSSYNETLEWVPCYTRKLCARLMVPLDYAKSDDQKAGIALIKVPSKHDPRHKDYKGPILFNPGGPGNSGVSAVETLGESLQKLLGDDYDMVGFDPRGVSRTIPQVNVFHDRAEGAAWRLREATDPLPNVTEDGVSRLWARSQVYGELAKQNTMGTSPYVSTALVARDMLSIMRAHGFDKLQYWGFSYGTVLGATYAAMFPNNVEKIIVDGVVDSYDYYAGRWSNNLLDTDKGYHMFMQSCVDAGPDICPLYEPTVARVHTRITDIFTSLQRRPLPVHSDAANPHGYGLVDYRTARLALFYFLYGPYARGGQSHPAMRVAHALAAAERGDGAPLSAFDASRELPLHCECPVPGQPAPPPAVDTPDTMAAIICADAAGQRLNDTVQDLEAHFHAMLETSEFAPAWPFGAWCSAWDIKPAERFSGAFVGNTSFPILLIGNTADPVTPLAHAHTMSKGYNGSVVLTQNSAGHCTLAATSLCTAKAIREYFREGKLPENGTVCEIEDSIFPTGKENVKMLSNEDQAIMAAWSDLSSRFEVPRLGMM